MKQNRRILPPIWFLLALLAMLALHIWAPSARIIEPPLTFLGALLMAVGIALALWASQLFASAGTPVVPFERSTALVRQGPFRISRNPMYLGMVITLIGMAWLLGTASPWLVVPVFVWIMHARFVRDEERFLEEIFGAEYVEYKKSVHRWI